LNSSPRILFITLDTFAHFGGIEKFNKNFLRALQQVSAGNRFAATSYSLLDGDADPDWFPPENYKGFNGYKISFLIRCFLKLASTDILILGHINLSPIAFAFKKIFPERRLILIAHGYEAWGKQKRFKKKCLETADQIWAVSTFTARQLASANAVSEDKIRIFPNTIGAGFNFPSDFRKPMELFPKYKIDASKKIILTITRLNSKESYKGYDTIIRLMPSLLKNIPGAVYIIGGKYDDEEYERLNKILREKGLGSNVILAGFIPEEDLLKYYLLADVFVLPSRKEGFGIVLIEAAACGLKVIAGNEDGSVDALANGTLGDLVSPTDEEAILKNMLHALLAPPLTDEEKRNNQEMVKDIFGFERFKTKLEKNLEDVRN
jgi:phosphatidylinositol alpha-1,6-mannosyltransferase